MRELVGRMRVLSVQFVHQVLQLAGDHRLNCGVVQPSQRLCRGMRICIDLYSERNRTA